MKRIILLALLCCVGVPAPEPPRVFTLEEAEAIADGMRACMEALVGGMVRSIMEPVK